MICLDLTGLFCMMLGTCPCSSHVFWFINLLVMQAFHFRFSFPLSVSCSLLMWWHTHAQMLMQHIDINSSMSRTYLMNLVGSECLCAVYGSWEDTASLGHKALSKATSKNEHACGTLWQYVPIQPTKAYPQWDASTPIKSSIIGPQMYSLIQIYNLERLLR